MAKMYLECEEQIYPLEENEISEDLPLDELDKMQAEMNIVPLALYRNPIAGGKEVDVDIDTTGLYWVYLVVVIYTKPDGAKWSVSSVHKTRREAKKIHDEIESGMFKGATPWDNEDCQFEECVVALVPVED